MRSIRYQEIATDLRTRVSDGEFSASRILPSEASLGQEYDASRVTIRRALEVLRDEGLVESRQGLGWMMAAPPVHQMLDTLATIEAQLHAAGRRSERVVLDFAFEAPPQWVQAILGSEVLAVRRLHRADDQPFARVTVWCQHDIGADVSRADVERASFLELLQIEWGEAHQTIGAAGAGPVDAELLNVPARSPVLVARRTTPDNTGRAILVSEHVFPAHLTEFEVALAPRAGVRLTDV